jgi:hypothetical protein
VSPESGTQTRVARWRVAAGVAVLVALGYFAALFAPIYFRNLELQNYVSGLARRPENQTKPDELLRTWVMQKADELSLPVRSGDVLIRHSADGLRVEVRYFVRVTMPGYTVDLHFYPGAGSR